MENNAFRKKNVNNQSKVDRFVFPRETLDALRGRRHLDQHRQIQKNPDFWCSNDQYQKRYATCLDKSFGLAKSQERQVQSAGRADIVQSWPCVPRKKPYMTLADNVLDLPLYAVSPFPELLDWNVNDHLVAALGKTYYMYSWRTQNVEARGLTKNHIYSCKFDPKGEYLALGTNGNFVEVHDSVTTKCVYVNHCVSQEFYGEVCTITALDWSPTGNSFVTGCSFGVLTTYARDGMRLRYTTKLRFAVAAVRISPNARFVAATAVGISRVLVFEWPSLRPFAKLAYPWVRSLAWHPWRSSLLAVGTMTSATVTLWDATTSSVRLTTTLPGQPNLDAMLFSHRTGELVLSLSNSDPHFSVESAEKLGSRLLVLSDPETVVDRWGESKALDCVRTLVFSPDGSKLAAATVQEDLVIWDYLPEDKKANKDRFARRMFSALPTFIDKTGKRWVHR